MQRKDYTIPVSAVTPSPREEGATACHCSGFGCEACDWGASYDGPDPLAGCKPVVEEDDPEEMQRLFEAWLDGLDKANTESHDDLIDRLAELRRLHAYETTVGDHDLFDWLTHTIAFVRSRKGRG